MNPQDYPSSGSYSGSSRRRRQAPPGTESDESWDEVSSSQDYDPYSQGPRTGYREIRPNLYPQRQQGSSFEATSYGPGNDGSSQYQQGHHPNYLPPGTRPGAYTEHPPNHIQDPYLDYDPNSGQTSHFQYRPEGQSRTQRNRPEKKYLCEYQTCPRSVEGQGFTTLNDLERHGRSIHNDAGQYIICREPGCPEGEKLFPRRDNFIDHWWRMHGRGQSKEQCKAQASELAKQWTVERRPSEGGYATESSSGYLQFNE